MQHLRSLDSRPPCVLTSFPTASTQTLWPHTRVLAGACLLKPYHHVLSTQGSPALTLNITKHHFVNNNSKTLKKNQWPLIDFELTQGFMKFFKTLPSAHEVVCEERWAFLPKWLWIPQTLKTHSTLWPLVSHWHPLKRSLWFWIQDGYGQYFLNPIRVFKCTWSAERHCVVYSLRHFSRTPVMLHPNACSSTL